MTDLVAFLRARLDEDEKIAVLIRRSSLDAPRPLRDVEAKRRIVDDCAEYRSPSDIAATDGLAGRALIYLALPYSDHPDYDPEWLVAITDRTQEADVP